jgi:hypothetical protein
MNRHSVSKKRPAKPSRGGTMRKVSRSKAGARRVVRKAEPNSTVQIATVTVAQVAAITATLRTHKYRVGQTVFYTSSPISRPGASGSYKVVRLLPSDGEDYQYRIKNPGEAFERVAKESQLDLEY